MSKVTFNLPMGVKARCKVTGLTGTVNSRVQAINGCIQYGIQPPITKKESAFIPEGYRIDEANLQLVVQKKTKPETVEFLYNTGDRVRNRVNLFEGIITHLVQHQNGCIAYMLEGPMKEGKEVKFCAWEQELEFVNAGLNAKAEAPVKRARTGGPTTRHSMVDKAF